MCGLFHLLGGQTPYVYHSSEAVPPHHSSRGECSLFGLRLQEEIVAQHRPLAALRSLPGSPQVCQMMHMLDSCLVKSCQRRDAPTMLQCVSQHRFIFPSLLLLLLLLLLMLFSLLLLLLLMMSLLVRLLVRVRLVDAADEALCQPLHFVQQVEAAAGTGHPCELRVLHDGPDLCLIQDQEAFRRRLRRCNSVTCKAL